MNTLEIGDKCRLRDGIETGMVSMIDHSGGWARVEWDDEFRDDMPEVWHLDSLVEEDEPAIEDQPWWGNPRLNIDPETKVEKAPTAGFWLTALRVLTGAVR